MPSSIPYDPSLVLANVVNPNAAKIVQDIAILQQAPDAQEQQLNSLIAAKRSLEMTKVELMNLGIDITKLVEKIKDLDARIVDVAGQYAESKITAEDGIAGKRALIQGVSVNVESPLDYVKSEIKTMPLASDSINMNVQYFSQDMKGQKSESMASSISSYIAASTSWMGIKASTEISAAASAQLSAQMEHHQIDGTLVLSISCTHKNAQILAPFVLDVDKGIKVYNHLCGDDKSAHLDPTDRAQMAAIGAEPDKDDPHTYSIVSGMTYGSSFVGMVHVLKTEDTSASQRLSSTAASLQAQMDAGAWFEGCSGGFGVSASFSDEVKSLLSTQNIQSHVTLLTMGVIPSIVSNAVKIGVKEFADFDPAKSMKTIATLQNATVAEQGTVQTSAQAARTGQQMISMKAGEVKAALSALKDVDDGQNKMLDINSMMTALEDYLKKASEGSGGVPLNYYIKDIDRKYLAEMWTAKYFPNQFMRVVGDDASGPVKDPTKDTPANSDPPPQKDPPNGTADNTDPPANNDPPPANGVNGQ